MKGLRLKKANRKQIQMEMMDVESLIPNGHRARIIWELVEGLDLSGFHKSIKSREGHAGQNAIDPAILVGLWMYATVEGVGSARALERLCYEHHGYRWIRGGVDVNHHTLSDFRTGHEKSLDDLFRASIAGLMAENLVKLRRVAQDGMKVKANAAIKSFRGTKTLEGKLIEVEEQIEVLKKELESDPRASERRQAQRTERILRERRSRVQKALNAAKEIGAKRAKSHKKKSGRKEESASTTDAEARIMRMAYGGFAPAYNVQLATDVDSRVIVGLEVVDTVDQGQIAPMLENIRENCGKTPREHITDGGYVTHYDVRKAWEQRVLLYAPVPEQMKKPRQDKAIDDWKERMKSEECAKARRDRSSVAEWINAVMRNRGLRQFLVRGKRKVKSLVLWQALTHNLLQGRKLQAA